MKHISHARPWCRRGVAAMELAVCLPLIALLVFGSIQACNLIFLKHAITSAAYEGTLELIRPSATNASVATRIDQVLATRGVTNYDVAILPAGTDLTVTSAGNPVQIRVRADVGSNLALDGWFPTTDQVEYTAASPR